ncbi:MAG: MBL fold metallo-hydrolase [Desulfatibacillaceae bacterium]
MQLDVMTITDGLWQVGGDVVTTPEDGAIYLLRHGAEYALVDAGCGRNHKQVVSNITTCAGPKPKIAWLFLTHCHWDHTGGAEKLAGKYQAKVVAHVKDAGFLEEGDDQVTAAAWYGARMEPLRLDHAITGAKETFTVGDGKVTAHHMPGHSPGSLVYTTILDGEKIMFGQDVHGPISPLLLSDEADYRKSLKRMADMRADILCEGHFGVIEGKAKVEQFIRQYIK